jgi:hypothetical protein
MLDPIDTASLGPTGIGAIAVVESTCCGRTKTAKTAGTRRKRLVSGDSRFKHQRRRSSTPHRAGKLLIAARERKSHLFGDKVV